LLVIEEEITSLTGTIALAEQNYDRIRFDYSQRERRLRYAILDLNMDCNQLQIQSQLADASDRADLAQQQQDLQHQIGQLTNRCDEVEAERERKIKDLDDEINEYRTAIHQRQREADETLRAIHHQIEALRVQASSQKLRESYQKLDKLRADYARGLIQ
jgi:chromosome segregation ATPase